MSHAMRPAEAAEFMRCSIKTLTRSHVPFYYMNPTTKRKRRYSKAAILAWIELQTMTPPPEPAHYQTAKMQSARPASTPSRNPTAIPRGFTAIRAAQIKERLNNSSRKRENRSQPPVRKP